MVPFLNVFNLNSREFLTSFLLGSFKSLISYELSTIIDRNFSGISSLKSGANPSITRLKFSSVFGIFNFENFTFLLTSLSSGFFLEGLGAFVFVLNVIESSSEENVKNAYI